MGSGVGYRSIEAVPWNRYGLIMADPAWTFRNWSKKGEGKNPVSIYDCMTIEEIKALPVSLMAAPDCILWLWATNPMLPQQIAVLEAWGFTYVTSGAWKKKTKHGKDAFGTGYALRGSGEPYLIGKIGKPKFGRSVRSHFSAPIRENSRKPDRAYFNAERMAVGTEERLDLFSRQVRHGWDAMGDQFDHFPALGENWREGLI